MPAPVHPPATVDGLHGALAPLLSSEMQWMAAGINPPMTATTCVGDNVDGGGPHLALLSLLSGLGVRRQCRRSGAGHRRG
jgi:hypothetical protein